MFHHWYISLGVVHERCEVAPVSVCDARSDAVFADEGDVVRVAVVVVERVVHPAAVPQLAARVPMGPGLLGGGDVLLTMASGYVV